MSRFDRPTHRLIDQQRAIRRVFEAALRPLSVTEILSQGQLLSPGLAIATVKRSVDEFTRKGWLRRVEPPGVSSSRYEQATLAHHHHFHCRLCDRLFDVAHCSPDLEPPLEEFDIFGHEVFFFGLCPDCATQQAQ